MNLVQKIEEWLEGEVESNQEHVDAHANGETHISIDGDIIIGRHECAESLLAQIKKWKKELGIETKKYNSLVTIAFSVLHDEEDGSDITAHHIRERLTERINCDDQEVCEAVGVGVREHLKDTFEN